MEGRTHTHTHTVLRSFPWAILEKPGRNPHSALLPGTLTKNRYFRKRKVKKSEPAHSLWKQSPSGATARTCPLPALPSSPPRTPGQPRTSQLAQSVSLWLGPGPRGAERVCSRRCPQGGSRHREQGDGFLPSRDTSRSPHPAFFGKTGAGEKTEKPPSRPAVLGAPGCSHLGDTDRITSPSRAPVWGETHGDKHTGASVLGTCGRELWRPARCKGHFLWPAHRYSVRPDETAWDFPFPSCGGRAARRSS